MPGVSVQQYSSVATLRRMRSVVGCGVLFLSIHKHHGTTVPQHHTVVRCGVVYLSIHKQLSRIFLGTKIGIPILIFANRDGCPIS
jgi:hypothetical protein